MKKLINRLKDLEDSNIECPDCHIKLKIISDGDEETTDCLICPICVYEEGGGLRKTCDSEN